MRDSFHKLFLLFMSFLSLTGWGDRLASLPGGLLFPVFSSAGLVNSAALVMDWRTEARVLYSPATNPDTPQSYLSSLGHSNGRLGFNIGYQGSYQENIALSGGFLAGAFRLSRLAIGFSARNTDLKNASLWKTDLSAIYALTYKIRLGASLFGLDEDQQLGFGLGFGTPQKQTFEIDFLAPVNPQGRGLTDQYSASVALTSFFEKVGFSGGLRFDKQQDGFSNPDRLSGFLGSTVSVSRSLNITTLYQTNPATFTFGLAWVWAPPARNQIQYFKEQNRKIIWNRGR